MSHNQDATAEHKSNRLFLALWPDTTTARALYERWSSRAAAPGARAVSPQRLHLTLHFLGNIARPRVPELAVALRVPFTPFDLSFSRCAQWPHGLLVTTPDAMTPPLTQLHATLGQALRGLGLPVDDRPLRPHVTLARRHSGMAPAQAGPPVPWPVRGYVLVESRTTPVAQYRTVHVYG